MRLNQRVFLLLAGRNEGADATLNAAGREAMPRNFALFVFSHFLTRLGDALSNPKTTLTWLAGALGVPTWITALLVPLRESGSMLLQIGVAGVVQRFERRRWAWSLASVLQGLSLFGMAWVAFTLRGLAAGLLLLALLGALALARSLASVASKDVLGRILPRGRRGSATGWATGAAGAATLLLAAAATVLLRGGMKPPDYALLLIAAGALWFVAAGAFVAVREPVADDIEKSARSRLNLLFRDPSLRRFVFARALLMCTALSAPYYVLLAQRELGHAPQLLASFILAEGVASLLGGPIWGRMADRASKLVMAIGGATGGVLGVFLAVLALADASALTQIWLLPTLYFILALAHQAVRNGRKTYVVDMAEGNSRTDYVAVSNSAMGVLLLIVGAFTAALSAWALPAALAVLALMGLGGAAMSLRLPDVEG